MAAWYSADRTEGGCAGCDEGCSDCTPIPEVIEDEPTREIEAGSLLPEEVACAYGEACEFRQRLERERP